MHVRHVDRFHQQENHMNLSHKPTRSIACIVAVVCGTLANTSYTNASDMQAANSNVSRQSASEMEEVVVQGERVHPSAMALSIMNVIYQHKEKSARNFKIGKYEEAFPDLLRLAKLGFKDEQARVAYIYLHGLGGQQKSNLKALGWLGVASYGTTRPQYRNLFNQLLANIPLSHRVLVDTTVSDYRTRFAAKHLGITCERSRTGHLDKFTCLFDAQRARHIDRLLMIAKSGEVPWVLGSAAISASITP